MNEFLFHQLNGFVGTSKFIDAVLINLVDNSLLKGGLMMAAFWALWGWTDPANKKVRARLLALVFVAPVTVGIARALVAIFPFQSRPVNTDGLDVILVHPEFAGRLDGWSSFPSDHAVLFFCLATCLFLVNRTVGIAAYFHAAIVICLPRVILGLHWPADILGGAVIGVVLALVLTPLAERAILRLGMIDTRRRVLVWIYPLMFLSTYQIAVLFTDAREIVEALARFLVDF